MQRDRKNEVSTAAAAEDLEAQRAELGRLLGLEEPAPLEVLRAAVDDETYARNLLIARSSAELLGHLLRNPPRPASPASPLELAARGAGALLRWAASGFSVVGDEVYRRRLQACEACPHLTRPPERNRLLYQLAGTPAAERVVCSRCGCVVTRKARLPREACPEPHPTRSGLTRWAEVAGA